MLLNNYNERNKICLYHFPSQKNHSLKAKMSSNCVFFFWVVRFSLKLNLVRPKLSFKLKCTTQKKNEAEPISPAPVAVDRCYLNHSNSVHLWTLLVFMVKDNLFYHTHFVYFGRAVYKLNITQILNFSIQTPVFLSLRWFSIPHLLQIWIFITEC